MDVDVDPVDDGPPIKGSPPVPVYGSGLQPPAVMVPQQPVTEEEALQGIEMLRSDDLSNRIAAANRLDVVAIAIGSDRTRDVRTHAICDGQAPVYLCFDVVSPPCVAVFVEFSALRNIYIAFNTRSYIADFVEFSALRNIYIAFNTRSYFFGVRNSFHSSRIVSMTKTRCCWLWRQRLGAWSPL